MANVDKTYADALFTLLVEENSDKTVFDTTLEQLNAVRSVMSDVPDFMKLLGTPTIEDSAKISLISETFEGKVSDKVYNFLRLLTVNKRITNFFGIYNAYRALYNEKFDIAEITVTSSMPLTDELRGKITAKMAKITGKTIQITEKVDKAIIGGVMIDYGNTRFDGSVKTRLSELKKEISGVIA
jgi:F-type H+-transporting ATPase subunit delta